MERDIRKVKRESTLVEAPKQFFKVDKASLDKHIQLLKETKKSGKPFYDKEFPPVKTSIFTEYGHIHDWTGKIYKNWEFKRVAEIWKGKAVLFEGDINMMQWNDILREEAAASNAAMDDVYL